MKKHVLIFGLMALGAIILSGCQNEELMDNVGQPVKFTAASGYDNGIATRTAYSSEYFGDSPMYERIDWVQNDLIRIYSPQAQTAAGEFYSDYKVTDVTPNGRYSEAEVIQLTGNGLEWASGENTFYALYPAPARPGLPA